MACGAELGVGRFCLNCGHPIGAPAPVVQAPPPAPEPVAGSTIPPGAEATRQIAAITMIWTIDMPIASDGVDQAPSPTMWSA